MTALLVVVAVFDLEAKGVALKPDAIDRLSSFLETRVAASGQFEVIPRSAVKGRLTEQKKSSYAKCYDEACQIEIGKELAAEKIVDPSVIKIGGTCNVTLALVDLKKATTERATNSEGPCTEEGIASSLKKAAAELTAPKTAVEPPKLEPPKTRCEIDLGEEACPGDPSFTNAVDDNFENAGSDEARCLERAAEYFDWCGKTKSVTARFYSDEKLVRETKADAPSTCQIVLGEEGCPGTKDTRRAFNDHWEGSNQDAARCMKRAGEFHLWCGKQNEAIARFTSGGKIVREERASSPSRCEITVGDEGCPANGDTRILFNDVASNAHVDGARCLKRAREYFDWCGKKTAVIAKFVSGGKVVREERSLPASRCEITIGKEGCPGTGDVRAFFNDSWEGADTNDTRCMQRALEFYHWCGKAEPVTAKFFTGDKLVREQRASTPSRCEIIAGNQGCPATGDTRTRWNDDWNGSGSNGPGCLKRAEDYFNWCGATDGISANFIQSGNVAAQQTWKPATFCQITVPPGGCPQFKDTRTRFNDNHENAGSDQARCLKRAQEYKDWCPIGGKVEARFFSGGKPVASTTTR
jgi:hypothetical protein